MGKWTDAIFGRRDSVAAPVRMIGFPNDGGLTAGGVTATTSLGLSAVWRCLDILGNGVSQLPWREVMGSLEIPPSRLTTRPQADRTRREWTSLVISTMALYDVCYLLKVGGVDGEGVPLGLWPLDPRMVMPAQVDIPQIMLPHEYWVGATRLSADALVILRRSPQPTITDDVGGVIRLARTTFAAAIAAERYASRYWQAGGSPTTVLETDARLSDPEANQLSDRWAQKRALGPDHAPVMSSGLKAKSFGSDPTTESAVEARRELVADIGRYFGVPTRMVNAPTGDHETYTSTESANMDLVRFTLRNFIHAIEDAISDQLPAGRAMVMDTRQLTLASQLAQAQAYVIATGGQPWMLPAEVRDEQGLAPMELPPLPAPVPIAGGFPHG